MRTIPHPFLRFRSYLRWLLYRTHSELEECLCRQDDLAVRLRYQQDPLRESEAEYQALFEGSGIGNTEIEVPTGRFRRVNRKYCELVGYSADELLAGMSFFDLTHPDDREGDVAAMDRFNRDRQGQYEAEKRYIRKDGTVIWVHISAAVRHRLNSQSTCAMGSVYDITQRKRAEEALRSSETRFRTLAEEMPHFVWETDAAGVALYENTRWYDYTGLNHTQTRTGGWLTVQHPDDKSHMAEAWARAVRSGGEYDAYCRFRCAQDGTYRWFRVKGAPIRNAAGAIIRWVGTCTDVHEQREAMEKLCASERRFRSIFRHQFQFSAILTPDGRVCEISPSVLQATGVRKEQVVGRLFWEMPWWHRLPKMQEQWRRQIAQALSGSDPVRGEGVFHAGDGSLRFAVNTITAMRNDSGAVEMLIAEGNDYTERKRAEEELQRVTESLRRLNTELTRSNAELDAFTYSASHDLKEPLRGIRNFARFLQDDEAARLSDAGKEQLATIQRLARRMGELIDSLTQYSRVGRLELELRPINLVEVLDQVMEVVQPQIAEHGVSLRFPMNWPAIKADRIRVYEIFQNLISNAIKYNDKTERWVEVGYQSGDPPVFYVRDNGIGIKSQHREHIFKIFRRLHGREEYGGGTGVGLTITKKIIERHGGRIWVESMPGKGSIFYFTLAPCQ